MFQEYNFNVKENSKINFCDENFIFFHFSFKNKYIFINCKTTKWIFEKKFFINELELKLKIKLFQNYAVVEIENKLKLKYFYQVDLSYFKK